MERTTLPTDEPTLENSPPARRRGVVKLGLVVLVLAVIGGTAASKFVQPDAPPSSIVEYEKLNEGKALAREQKAEAQVEKNQLALKQAQADFETALAEYESAKTAKEQAEKLPTDTDLAEAESRLTKATEALEQAKARLKTAEDKLKTADQLRAEAEVERRRVEDVLAQEEAYHQALLGAWTRPDDDGKFRLELNEDGTGLMVVEFNATNRFLLGTSQMEVDITWHVANGNHVIFDSVAGRPENAFKVVSTLKGTHRDEVLAAIDENSFTTHHPEKKSAAKTWTRVAE